MELPGSSIIEGVCPTELKLHRVGEQLLFPARDRGSFWSTTSEVGAVFYSEEFCSWKAYAQQQALHGNVTDEESVNLNSENNQSRPLSHQSSKPEYREFRASKIAEGIFTAHSITEIRLGSIPVELTGTTAHCFGSKLTIASFSKGSCPYVEGVRDERWPCWLASRSPGHGRRD